MSKYRKDKCLHKYHNRYIFLSPLINAARHQMADWPFFLQSPDVPPYLLLLLMFRRPLFPPPLLFRTAAIKSVFPLCSSAARNFLSGCCLSVSAGGLIFPKFPLGLGIQMSGHLYLYGNILIPVKGSIFHGNNSLSSKPDLGS